MQEEGAPEDKKRKFSSERKIAPLKFLCMMQLNNAIKEKSILKGYLGEDLYNELCAVDTDTTQIHSLQVLVTVRRTTQKRSKCEGYDLGTHVDERVLPGPEFKNMPTIPFPYLDRLAELSSMRLADNARGALTIDQEQLERQRAHEQDKQWIPSRDSFDRRVVPPPRHITTYPEKRHPRFIKK